MVTFRGGGRPSLTVIALALSLALNLCFIGGVAYSHWVAAERPAATPERRLEVLAERLELKPEQMPHYEDFRRALRRSQGALGVQDAPLMRQAWDELRKSPPDPQVVQQLLDEMAMHRHAFQVDAAAALIHFMAVLTPEQRDILAKTVLDRKDPVGAPIRRNVGN